MYRQSTLIQKFAVLTEVCIVKFQTVATRALCEIYIVLVLTYTFDMFSPNPEM